MAETFSKLKITSRPTSSRQKNQPVKASTPTTTPTLRRQTGTQTQDDKTLLPSQSTKTLYKEKYEQCQERLGQENQYLREYVMDLNLKFDQVQSEMEKLRQNGQKLRSQRDELKNQVRMAEENEKRKYQDVLDQLRRENAERVSEYSSTISSLKEMMNIREMCISQLRSDISTYSQTITHLQSENKSLKTHIEQSSESKQPKLEDKEPRYPKRRAKSTFNSSHLKQLVIPDERHQEVQLSPKQAARMDVLFDEYNYLKSIVMRGNIDNSTAFRLITLIQYLRQTLSKKNIENAELKESIKQGFTDDGRITQLVERYQKTVFQCRQEIESLQCEVRILKDQRIQGKGEDAPRVSTYRNRSNYDSHNSSRRNSNSNSSIIHMNTKKESRICLGSTLDGERLINKQQENTWRVDSPFNQTQQMSYRELAKKQLIHKLDSPATIFSELRKRNGALSERRNMGQTNISQFQKQGNPQSTRCGLDEFLKGSNSLITYMNLVVKITEIVQKLVEEQTYKILTTKDILVTCQGTSPDSMKVRCELKGGDREIEQEYISPEWSGAPDELGVMWSIGVVFRKIFESIQTSNSEEEELFSCIVKPQFDKIVQSLVVEDPGQRMDMGTFKEMLTKLS